MMVGISVNNDVRLLTFSHVIVGGVQQTQLILVDKSKVQEGKPHQPFIILLRGKGANEFLSWMGLKTLNEAIEDIP